MKISIPLWEQIGHKEKSTPLRYLVDHYIQHSLYHLGILKCDQWNHRNHINSHVIVPPFEAQVKETIENYCREKINSQEA